MSQFWQMVTAATGIGGLIMLLQAHAIRRLVHIDKCLDKTKAELVLLRLRLADEYLTKAEIESHFTRFDNYHGENTRNLNANTIQTAVLAEKVADAVRTIERVSARLAP